MSEPALSAAAPDAEGTEIPATTPFAQVLHLHRGAGLHNEAGEALAEVVAAVREQQKKGSLTITLTIEPAKGDETQVVISDDLKTKVPKPAPQPSRFFSDARGNLSRRDPRQPELPLRDASKTP